jgi:SAM-dependent methyltransferase
LPGRCQQVLDLGCGTGTFSRLLAERAGRVLGLDLSPEMVRIARERSRGHETLEFQVADVTAWPFPSETFDCIASIATMHHLPLVDMLRKAKVALRVGGVLLILDLYQSQGVADALTDVVAVPVNLALRLLKTGRIRSPAAVRAAWAAHGSHDTYLTLSQVQRIAAANLPGAQVKKHLLWRYSLIWYKSATQLNQSREPKGPCWRC